LGALRAAAYAARRQCSAHGDFESEPPSLELRLTDYLQPLAPEASAAAALPAFVETIMVETLLRLDFYSELDEPARARLRGAVSTLNLSVARALGSCERLFDVISACPRGAGVTLHACVNLHPSEAAVLGATGRALRALRAPPADRPSVEALARALPVLGGTRVGALTHSRILEARAQRAGAAHGGRGAAYEFVLLT
jgi:hypothetical protein